MQKFEVRILPENGESNFLGVVYAVNASSAKGALEQVFPHHASRYRRVATIDKPDGNYTVKFEYRGLRPILRDIEVATI